MKARRLVRCALFIWLCGASVSAGPVCHYVFFGQDREKIRGAVSFLETRALEGAQVAYSWRQMEPEKDAYDFSEIREDLAFLIAQTAAPDCNLFTSPPRVVNCRRFRDFRQPHWRPQGC